MGQILGADIIATPIHSAGTITLPPSLLLLGGRQYRTSTLSRLIVTDVTLLANTLYFVYAQIVTSVPVLRVSASAPSAYKIANPTAKLVAGFYSDGLISIGLGSFVTINNSPSSDVWDSGSLVISSTGVTQPVKQTSGIVLDRVLTKRDGEKAYQRYLFRANGVVGATTGQGDYLFGIKVGSVNTNKVHISNESVGDGSQDYPGGMGTATSSHLGSDNGDGYCKFYSSTQFRAYADNATIPNNRPIGGTHFGLANVASGVTWSFELEFQIANWNNTQLVDL